MRKVRFGNGVCNFRVQRLMDLHGGLVLCEKIYLNHQYRLVFSCPNQNSEI
jgi:hypothetical protein